MVDEKNLEEETKGTGTDEGVAKVKLTKKTENEEPAANETLSPEEEEKGFPKGKIQAEKVFNDFVSTIRDRQEDFSKVISDYTTALEKPLADVIETDDEIIIKTDLPNVKKGDININLTETTIEITAKFEEEYKEEEVNYIRRERNYGETTKIIELPAKVKVKDASAKFEDSILTITLPKVEAEKIKVEIK